MTLSDLTAKLRAFPSLAASYLLGRLDSIESSISGLAADVSGMTCLSGDAVGDWMYISSANTVTKADADGSGTYPAVGVIVSKQSSTSCTVRVAGLVTGLSGLTAGAVYYLSTTAGAITATAPTAPAAAPVAIAVATTKLVVVPLGALSAALRSTAANLGANVIGYQDGGSKTAATDVDAALDEIYADRLSTSRCASIRLGDWREVNATGDVGNIAANGGILASDTTPILRGDANNSWEIFWAASNSDPIGLHVSVPPDLDDTAAAVLELDVYSGSTDAATMGIATSWNGGAEVTDSADDSGTKSATVHTISATIAAGDIPASSRRVTIRLTPPTHTTDGIGLVEARLRYTPKLLT